jgi:magnesium and cobalt transporter
LDDNSGSSGIWQRLGKLFHGRHDADTVEQAIRDASEDGELDKEEGSMLLSVLSLDELQVRDIMTPRTDIACAPEENSIREAANLIIATGHSRIPIFSGNRDNITGILHAKDLLEHILNPSKHDPPISRIMREPFFVPETKNVLALLHEFRTSKLHLAVIVDEYGGTAGLVTIEDVIEQIVGDIEDEHDAPREEEISLQQDGSYLIAGRAYLEDMEEVLGLKISSNEVDTLGGYLTHLAGRVPIAGDTFTLEDLDGVIFTVVDADVKQIRTVRMIKPDIVQDSSIIKNADTAVDEFAPQAIDMAERQNASNTKT